MNARAFNALPITDLMAMPEFSNLLFPAPDSRLIKKRPGFILDLMENRVFQLFKSGLGNRDLNIEISFRSEILFGELIRVVNVKKKVMNDVLKLYGFNMDCLPDNRYLLAVIGSIDSSSPFYNEWPCVRMVKETLATSLASLMIKACSEGRLVQVKEKYSLPATDKAVKKAFNNYRLYRILNKDLKDGLGYIKDILEGGHISFSEMRQIKDSGVLNVLEKSVLSQEGKHNYERIRQLELN